MAVAIMVSVIFRGAISGYAAKAGKHPLTLKPIAMLRKTKGNTIARNLSKRTRIAKQAACHLFAVRCPLAPCGAADILRSMLKEHAGSARWRMSPLRDAQARSTARLVTVTGCEHSASCAISFSAAAETLKNPFSAAT
jgi:sugar (pentulose or hexulose) kinase